MKDKKSYFCLTRFLPFGNFFSHVDRQFDRQIDRQFTKVSVNMHLYIYKKTF